MLPFHGSEDVRTGRLEATLDIAWTCRIIPPHPAVRLRNEVANDHKSTNLN